ncbi:MAG: glycosyltransferase family 39 protein [Chloroflexi bacterium]|uniref:ArnT family glycosyltransferase n=1 Tax=Candidatus Flexifilum breve TaxID=3140694 RepID=UPI0031353C7D|nr:glycosyltransferase family 39 protein [Chloroflexota bacterium]
MWLTTWNPAYRTVEIGAVTVLLLFAAALRIIGISAGAPDMAYFPADAAQNLLPIEAPIHPDEFLYVTTPLHMRAKHRLNPDFFENPTFLINLNLLTYIVTDTGSDLVWEAIKEIGQRQIAPFSLYVIGRWYSVLGGLLAVAATYAAARVVAGRFAALSAGLLVAVALPMVQHAHYATTSSLAAGFVALCLWASFAFVRQRRWRLFMLACLAAGFAATNRYNAAAVALVPFALGSVLIWRKQVKPLPVLLAWFGVPLAFLIGSPQILRDFSKFIADFRYIYSGYAVTGQGAMGFTPYGLLYEYRYLITVALGIPGFLAALIGVGVLGREPRRESRLLLGLLLAYILPYSLVVLRTVRPSYSDQLQVPVIPAFAVLIGVGAAALARIPALRRVRVLIPVLLITTPLLFTLSVVPRFAATHTRLLMTAWITQHIPAGARIHLDGSYNVPLDRTRYSVTQNYAGDFPTLETLCQADYVIFSDAWFNDVERSEDLVSATDLELVRGQRALLETQFVELARIERPLTLGRDLFMHTATYWHDPQIIVYRVPAACSGG